MAPAAALGPRPVVLDRRQGRRADRLRHDRLSPRRSSNAQDRPADRRLRQERRRRSEGRRGLRQEVNGKGSRCRSRSRPARSASTRRPRWSSDIIVGVVDGRRAALRVLRTTPRASCAPSTRGPASCSGASTRFPSPGEFGNETWENDSWQWTGNTGVWTEISVDRGSGPRVPAGRVADHRLLRRPSAGQQPVRREPGGRRSEDRQAEVALPVRAPSALGLRPVGAPLLVERHDRRQAAQGWWRSRASRAGSTSFDRITGEPIWPMAETPVPQSDVPGEKTSPTQPFPTKPPAYSRNFLAPDDVIDFTPELRAQALENLKKYPLGADAVRAMRRFPNGKDASAAINVGNTWAASTGRARSFDPETGDVLHAGQQLRRRRTAIAARVLRRIRLEPSAGSHCASGSRLRPAWLEAPSTSGYRAPQPQAGGSAVLRRAPPRSRDGSWTGLPIVKPPYGVISAHRPRTAARSSGRCRTATRPTPCATARCSRA